MNCWVGHGLVVRRNDWEGGDHGKVVFITLEMPLSKGQKYPEKVDLVFDWDRTIEQIEGVKVGACLSVRGSLQTRKSKKVEGAYETNVRVQEVFVDLPF